MLPPVRRIRIFNLIIIALIFNHSKCFADKTNGRSPNNNINNSSSVNFVFKPQYGAPSPVDPTIRGDIISSDDETIRRQFGTALFSSRQSVANSEREEPSPRRRKRKMDRLSLPEKYLNFEDLEKELEKEKTSHVESSASRVEGSASEVAKQMHGFDAFETTRLVAVVNPVFDSDGGLMRRHERRFSRNRADIDSLKVKKKKEFNAPSADGIEYDVDEASPSIGSKSAVRKMSKRSQAWDRADDDLKRLRHFGLEELNFAFKHNKLPLKRQLFSDDPRALKWVEPKMGVNCWLQKMMAYQFDFSPSCEIDGRFSNKQCFMERCWCVSNSGVPRESDERKRFYYAREGDALICTADIEPIDVQSRQKIVHSEDRPGRKYRGYDVGRVRSTMGKAARGNYTGGTTDQEGYKNAAALSTSSDESTKLDSFIEIVTTEYLADVATTTDAQKLTTTTMRRSSATRRLVLSTLTAKRNKLPSRAFKTLLKGVKTTGMTAISTAVITTGNFVAVTTAAGFVNENAITAPTYTTIVTTAYTGTSTDVSNLVNVETTTQLFNANMSTKHSSIITILHTNKSTTTPALINNGVFNFILTLTPSTSLISATKSTSEITFSLTNALLSVIGFTTDSNTATTRLGTLTPAALFPTKMTAISTSVKKFTTGIPDIFTKSTEIFKTVSILDNTISTILTTSTITTSTITILKGSLITTTRIIAFTTNSSAITDRVIVTGTATRDTTIYTEPNTFTTNLVNSFSVIETTKNNNIPSIFTIHTTNSRNTFASTSAVTIAIQTSVTKFPSKLQTIQTNAIFKVPITPTKTMTLTPTSAFATTWHTSTIIVTGFAISKFTSKLEAIPITDILHGLTITAKDNFITTVDASSASHFTNKIEAFSTNSDKDNLNATSSTSLPTNKLEFFMITSVRDNFISTIDVTSTSQFTNEIGVFSTTPAVGNIITTIGETTNSHFTNKINVFTTALAKRKFISTRRVTAKAVYSKAKAYKAITTTTCRTSIDNVSPYGPHTIVSNASYASSAYSQSMSAEEKRVLDNVDKMLGAVMEGEVGSRDMNGQVAEEDVAQAKAKINFGVVVRDDDQMGIEFDNE